MLSDSAILNGVVKIAQCSGHEMSPTISSARRLSFARTVMFGTTSMVRAYRARLSMLARPMGVRWQVRAVTTVTSAPSSSSLSTCQCESLPPELGTMQRPSWRSRIASSSFSRAAQSMLERLR
jgi:hypothetical protein